uniref:Vacuolar protein-sorting-associated protein 25 n=1 Tax=Coccidioides posadasii RMSCC 3488 TaxID=454284 RepID=A0A0J6F5E7_COCPO|nr:vacuolar protein-sorting-associated protein 25 [Coccidioides posadasii RMSCC 3488]
MPTASRLLRAAPPPIQSSLTTQADDTSKSTSDTHRTRSRPFLPMPPLTSHPATPTPAEQNTFPFPAPHSFPPFFTLQPNAQTLLSQLQKWSALIQAYCRHHRLYRLSLVDALDSPLFHNKQIRKRLSLVDARRIVDWMCGAQGGRRAEWVGGEAGGKSVAWIWWRRPEEWAGVIADWVEETAQKNTVLTLYELTEGEATMSQEFHGMDPDVLQKSLHVLVKRGKAQVFGNEDQQGVKFF